MSNKSQVESEARLLLVILPFLTGLGDNELV